MPFLSMRQRLVAAAALVARPHRCFLMGKQARLRREQIVRSATSWKVEELPYSGILAHVDQSSKDFSSDLSLALAKWIERQYVSAWLRIPLAEAGLASEAAQHGFKMHHAPADGETLILYKWLQKDTEDKVPFYAPATQIGCAGFLVNNDREVLVIKEWRTLKNGTRIPSHMWKLPGGLADPGENILDAAARETFEETGIKCHGISVLAFWHRHQVQPWNKSDIYAVVRLRQDEPYSEISLCPTEVAAARWAKIDNYLSNADDDDEEHNHPLVRKLCQELYASKRPEPSYEIIDLGVTFPGRDTYPTYFPQQVPPNISYKIKAIASDVDGTLLMSNSELHPINAAAIQSLKDMTFFPATGKCRAGARKSLTGIPIVAGVFTNGLVVYNDEDTIIFERTLNKETIEKTQELAAHYNFDLVAYCRDELFSPTPEALRVSELAEKYSEPKPQMWQKDCTPNKLLILGDPQALLEARLSIEKSLISYATITTAMSNMLEVLPLGASKRVGVQALCQHLGIDEDTELLAIGDGENDIEMLRHAAVGIALDNASPAVKRAADFIVNDNDSAGAARALRIATALS